MARDLKEEAGLPEVLGERDAQGIGVGDGVAKVGEVAAGVGEHDGQGELADVGEVGYAERVPGLGVPVVGAAVGSRPRLPDAIDVAIEPVDVDAADDQPAAAVDPGSPLTALGDLRVRPRHVAGDRPEGGGVEVALAVEAEVDVRLGGVLAAGPAAAEDDSDHAIDGGEALRERGQVEPVGDGAVGESHPRVTGPSGSSAGSPSGASAGSAGSAASFGRGLGDADDVVLEVDLRLAVALVAWDLRLDLLAVHLLAQVALPGVEDLPDAAPAHTARLTRQPGRRIPGARGRSASGYVREHEDQSHRRPDRVGDRARGDAAVDQRPPDHDQGVATIHAALDAGVTLIDTTDAYCLKRLGGPGTTSQDSSVRRCGRGAATCAICSSATRVATSTRRVSGRWTARRTVCGPRVTRP